MPEFKVGDWVRCVFKRSLVFLIRDEQELKNFSTFDYREYEPWEPERGDVCVFSNGTISVISRFYAIEHNRFTESIEFKNYKYCEPFIGDIPTFLKDTNEH